MNNEDLQLIKNANMPQKKQEHVINNLNTQLKNDTEKSITKQLQEYLDQDFYSWIFQVDKNNHKTPIKQFELPKLLIDLENQNDMFLIKLPEFNEVIPRTKLNKIQLKQLKNTGTFQVESKRFSMNYTWKVSGLLYQGTKKRKWNYEKFLSHSYKLILEVWRTVSFQKFLYCLNQKKFYRKNIFLSLFQIYVLLINLIEFIIGLPYKYYWAEYYKLRQDWIKQTKMQKILRQNYPDNKILFEKLLYQSDKENQYFRELQEFKEYYRQQWETHKQKQIEKINDTDEEYYKQQINEIESQKSEFLINQYISDETFYQFDKNFKQILIKKYLSTQIQLELKQQKNQELEDEKQNIKKRIEQDYKVKSKIESWYNQYFDKQLNIYSEQLNDKYDQILISRFEKLNLHEEKDLYFMLKHTDLEFDKSSVQRKKILKTWQTYDFMTLKNKFVRPGKVSKVEPQRGQPYYVLQNFEQKSVYLKYPFWRLVYWLKRLFYHTKNFYIKTLRISFLSQWGLKGLFCCDEYFLQYSCNSETGELQKDQEKQTPIGKKFKNVLDGIRLSRKNFEDEKREGLFGKNLSRIFNYIECYFFRLFLVGILFVLLVHPIINIFVFVIFLILNITAFVWIFIKLCLFTLLKIFIFDFDCVDYRNVDRMDLISWQSQFYYKKRTLPIFHILVHFLFFFLFQMLHCILILCTFPVLALLIFIWANIRYLIRFILDSFVFYLIIKPFAKIPERDTFEVQKIEGPGVSNNLFFTLTIEDCIQLLVQFLEIKRLEKFQKIILEELRAPKENLKQKCNRMFLKFNFTVDIQTKQVDQSIQYYENILNQQINDRKKLLQKQNFIQGYYKIKFTDDQLQQLIYTTEEILKNNLDKFDLQNHIWKLYDVKVGHYKRLTSIVIKELFPQSFNIFESIEMYEKELVLKNSPESQSKHQYFKDALKGKLFTSQVIAIKNRSKQQNPNISYPCTDIMCSWDFVRIHQNEYFKIVENEENQLYFQQNKNYESSFFSSTVYYSAQQYPDSSEVERLKYINKNLESFEENNELILTLDLQQQNVLDQKCSLLKQFHETIKKNIYDGQISIISKLWYNSYNGNEYLQLDDVIKQKEDMFDNFNIYQGNMEGQFSSQISEIMNNTNCMDISELSNFVFNYISKILQEKDARLQFILSLLDNLNYHNRGLIVAYNLQLLLDVDHQFLNQLRTKLDKILLDFANLLETAGSLEHMTIYGKGQNKKEIILHHFKVVGAYTFTFSFLFLVHYIRMNSGITDSIYTTIFDSFALYKFYSIVLNKLKTLALEKTPYIINLQNFFKDIESQKPELTQDLKSFKQKLQDQEKIHQQCAACQIRSKKIRIQLTLLQNQLKYKILKEIYHETSLKQ